MGKRRESTDFFKMSVDECTSSAEVAKTVGNPTAAEAPAPDKPARGMADEEGEGDKGGQGTPADHEVLPEGGDGKEGNDVTTDGTPMEEETPEVADPTKKQRPKYMITYFVSAFDKSGQMS